MTDFGAQTLEQAARFGHNFANVSILPPAPQTSAPVQAKQRIGDQPVALTEQRPNQTGLPDHLKAGIENLSGLSLDNVKVHFNSDKPAQLQALAYARGTEIHVAPGPGQHLPHEAWHVVQQAQGRVRATMQMKGGVPVNDDQGLEREADEMGSKAAVAGNLAVPSPLFQGRAQRAEAPPQRKPIGGQVNDGLGPIQRTTIVEYEADPIYVDEDRVIEDIAHDRVLHTQADKHAAALASGYAGIPAGMICNHYESYDDVRQRVYGQLIGLDLDAAAHWINHRHGNLHPIGMGNYRRFDVNSEVSTLIEVLANNVNNLYYWPAKNGGNPDAPTGLGPGGAPVGPQLARLNAYRATLP